MVMVRWQFMRIDLFCPWSLEREREEGREGGGDRGREKGREGGRGGERRDRKKGERNIESTLRYQVIPTNLPSRISLPESTVISDGLP